MKYLEDKIYAKGYWWGSDNDNLVSNSFLDIVYLNFETNKLISIDFQTEENEILIVIDGVVRQYTETPITIIAKNIKLLNSSFKSTKLILKSITVDGEIVELKNLVIQTSDKLIITSENSENQNLYKTKFDYFSNYDFIVCKSILKTIDDCDILEKLWFLDKNEENIIKRNNVSINHVFLDCFENFKIDNNINQIKFNLKVLVLELIKAYHESKITFAIKNKELNAIATDIFKFYDNVEVLEEFI